MKIFKIILSFTILTLICSCKTEMNDGQMFEKANSLQKEARYQEAIKYYTDITEKFPDSRFAPQSQFMIGFIYANELKDLENAKSAYEKFLLNYPNHAMASDTKWELEHLGQDIPDIEDLTTGNDNRTPNDSFIKSNNENKGKYLQYDYWWMTSNGKTVAIYSPFLPRNDTIVIGAMFDLINTVYGEHKIVDQNPQLVYRNGTNVVLFKGVKKDYLFLIIKEDTGEVNSLTLWTE